MPAAKKPRHLARLAPSSLNGGDRSTEPGDIFVDKPHARHAEAARFLHYNGLA